jgi:hypothetical protein
MKPISAIWHLSEASVKRRSEERYTQHIAFGSGAYPVAIIALYPRSITDPTAAIVDGTGRIDEARIDELQVIDGTAQEAIRASQSWMAANPDHYDGSVPIPLFISN